jgi:hypothetical protein
LYLADHQDLEKALLIFQEYSRVSGMKLNISKCAVVPFGSLISVLPPANHHSKWLSEESELERLLGLPVGVDFSSSQIWQ